MSSFSSGPSGPPPVRSQGQPAFHQHRPPGGERSWVLPVLGCGGVAVLALIVICGGFYGIARFGVPATVYEPPAPIDTVDTPVIDIAEFDGVWDTDGDRRTRSQVGRFLSRLETVKGQPTEFRALVDYTTHMKRYFQSYRFSPDLSSRLQLEQYERERFEMPREAAEFRIVAITEPSSVDLLVYTYAQKGAYANTPYVFHLRRTLDDFMLVDWIEAPELKWSSEVAALVAGPRVGDYAGSEQDSLYNDVQLADAYIRRGEYEPASEALKRAEGRQAVRELDDNNRYLIALRWQSMYRNDDALRVCNEAGDSPGCAWVDYMRASLYSRKGDYEKALLHANQYENAVGFHLDMAEVQVTSLEALDRKSEAAETALAMVRYAPESSVALRAAFSHTPPEQLDAVFEAIPQRPEVANILANSVAPQLLNLNQRETHQRIRDFIAASFPDASYLDQLDFNQLYYDGKLEEAYAVGQRILDAADEDSEDFYSPQYQLLEVAAKLFEPDELYEKSNHRRELVELIYDDYEYDEMLLTARESCDIMRRHCEVDTEDPRRSLYLATLARQDEDWELAKQEFGKALAASDDEYLTDSIRYERYYAACKLGEATTAYLKAADPDDAYQTIAGIVLGDADFETLQKLNILHRRNHDSLWLRYYELRVAENEASKAEDSAKLLELAAEYQKLADRNKASEEIYPYTLTAQINKLHSEHQNWKTLLRDSENAPQQFNTIVARLQREHKDDQLKEFVRLFREQYPNDASLQIYDVKELFAAKNYQDVIRFTSPWPPFNQQGYYSSTYQVKEYRLKAQLLTGDVQGAMETAEKPYAESRYQLIVHMAKQDAAAVRKLVEGDTPAAALLLPPADFWRDVPAINEFIESNEFRQLRDEVPSTLNTSYASRRGVLFFDLSHEWSAQDIADQLSKTNARNAEAVALDCPQLVSNTIRVRVGESEFLITFGDGGMADLKYVREYGGALNDEFAEAMEHAGQWVAVETTNSDMSTIADFDRVLSTVAGDASAIYVNDGLGNHLWRQFPDGFASTAENQGVIEELKPVQQYMWAPLGNWKLQSISAARLYQNGKKLSAGDAAGRVLIQIRQGSAVEEHWLKVVSVKSVSYGDFNYVAEFETDSQLNPFMKAGDRVNLSEYEIVDFKP